MKKILLCCAAVTMLSACDPKTETTSTASADIFAPASKWNGKWTGPEGTYLKIELGTAADGVTVKIRNLDGERSFAGTVENKLITFERDGKAETIRGGTGEETGMKWLADKTDCLIVAAGEGYCRK